MVLIVNIQRSNWFLKCLPGFKTQFFKTPLVDLKLIGSFHARALIYLLEQRWATKSVSYPGPLSASMDYMDSTLTSIGTVLCFISTAMMLQGN